jgi:hypothetical protein
LWPSLTHDAFEEGLCKLHRMDRVCLEPYQVPIILKINFCTEKIESNIYDRNKYCAYKTSSWSNK